MLDQPLIALGTWKLGKAETADAVFEALKMGYRALDCACDYGNEVDVGVGIARAIAAGVCERADIFITSKLWCTFHRPEHVRLAVDKTLADLGLTYIDLYLIHFPIPLRFVPIETRYPPEWIFDPSAPHPRMEFEKVPLAHTWAAMEELQVAGLAHRIGVCNFSSSLLRDLMAGAKRMPDVLQVER